MPELYTPLRIAEQMKLGREQQAGMYQKDPVLAQLLMPMPKGAAPKDALAREVDLHMGFQEAVGPEIANVSLDLDDFLNWALGSTFCKKSYKGTYQDLNQKLLCLYARFRERDQKATYRACRERFRHTVAFTTVFRCWEQYKQAYRFDSAFIKELMQTHSVEIPIRALKRLPFRCFYLDLEDTGQFHPFIGIFAYIGYDEQDGYPNLAMYRIGPRTRDGEDTILPTCASGKDMERWGMLFTNGAGEFCIRFTNDPGLLEKLPGQEDIEVFDSMMFVLQAMMYLSSSRPDTMASPKRKYVYTGKPGGCRKQAGTDVSLGLTDVGVRYGTVIRKANKEPAETEVTVIERSTGKKRPRASHVRSAHWHHYWAGKGRTELVVRWIPPTFVSGTGKDFPVTIHKVRK